jgi:hypothetical protein
VRLRNISRNFEKSEERLRLSLGIWAPRPQSPVRHGDLVGSKLPRQLRVV